MQDASIGDVPVVLLALTLTLVGVMVTMTCSWMSSKKRRVASNALHHRDGLMLHLAGKPSSPRTKPPSKRYSTPTPVLILPINSIAHTLVTPTIIITPPSPLALFADSTSIRSDSSIGSAGDLLIEDDGADDNNEVEDDVNKADFCGDSLQEEKVKREKKKYIAVQDKQHFVEPVLYRVHEYNNGTGASGTVTTPKRQNETAGGVSSTKKSPSVHSATNASDIQTNSRNHPPHIVSVNVLTTGQDPDLRNNSTIGKGQDRQNAEVTHLDEFTDSEYQPVLGGSRPRLKSMEPGTKRSDFHFHGSKQINSQMQVGKA